MKNLFKVLLCSMMMLTIVGCAANNQNVSKTQDVQETITIKTLNGNKEEVQIDVPYSASRIAVLDLATLIILIV